MQRVRESLSRSNSRKGNNPTPNIANKSSLNCTHDHPSRKSKLRHTLKSINRFIDYESIYNTDFSSTIKIHQSSSKRKRTFKDRFSVWNSPQRERKKGCLVNRKINRELIKNKVRGEKRDLSNISPKKGINITLEGDQGEVCYRKSIKSHKRSNSKSVPKFSRKSTTETENLVNSLQKKNSDLQKKFNELKEKYNILEEEIKSKVSDEEFQKIKTTNDQLQKENQELEQKLETCQKEKEDIQLKFDEVKDKVLKEEDKEENYESNVQLYEIIPPDGSSNYEDHLQPIQEMKSSICAPTLKIESSVCSKEQTVGGQKKFFFDLDDQEKDDLKRIYRDKGGNKEKILQAFNTKMAENQKEHKQIDAKQLTAILRVMKKDERIALVQFKRNVKKVIAGQRFLSPNIREHAVLSDSQSESEIEGEGDLENIDINNLCDEPELRLISKETVITRDGRIQTKMTLLSDNLYHKQSTNIEKSIPNNLNPNPSSADQYESQIANPKNMSDQKSQNYFKNSSKNSNIPDQIS